MIRCAHILPFEKFYWYVVVVVCNLSLQILQLPQWSPRSPPFRETDVDDMLLWAGSNSEHPMSDFEFERRSIELYQGNVYVSPRISICIDDRSIGFFWAIYQDMLWTPQDVDDMMLWAGDDGVTRTIRWKTLTSKEEALTFIKEVCIPHPWRRSICIDDRSIGFVSVLPGSGDDRSRADVGYAIAFEYWGQGIATEAVKMAIPQVYRDFPQVIRLQALADVENKASQRVLEKVGFIKEGILRKYGYHKGKIVDLVMYSLLSTESIY